jgi:hypothetical protein
MWNNFELNLKTLLSSIWTLNSNPTKKNSNTKWNFENLNNVITISILLLLHINPNTLLLGF